MVIIKNKISFATSFVLVFFFCLVDPGIAEKINAQKLLELVDKNLWADTKFITGRLIIDNGRKVRTLNQASWMEGVTRPYSQIGRAHV